MGSYSYEVKARAFSLNATYKCGKVYFVNGKPKANFYMCDKAKDFKEQLYFDIALQTKKKYPDFKILKNEVHLYVKAEYKRKGKRDIDNSLKIILDSLIGVVYEDDSLITKMLVEKETGCKEDKIIIKVKGE